MLPDFLCAHCGANITERAREKLKLCAAIYFPPEVTVACACGKNTTFKLHYIMDKVTPKKEAEHAAPRD